MKKDYILVDVKTGEQILLKNATPPSISQVSTDGGNGLKRKTGNITYNPIVYEYAEYLENISNNCFRNGIVQNK